MKTKAIKKYISLLTLCVLCICLLLPSKAFAYNSIHTFSWKTTINSSISTDGSIQVNEQRIIDITKFIEKAKKYTPSPTNTSPGPKNTNGLNPLVWGFGSFPQETDVVANDAKIAILGNDDKVIGNWASISTTTFLSKWYKEQTPNYSCVAYDEEHKEMCMFTELVNQDILSERKCAEILTGLTGSSDPNTWNMTKAIINFDYIIERAPVIYKDVADFNWSYISDTWKSDSYNVNLTVNIPVGKESIASPLGKVSSVSNDTTERNIYAWGHGSSTGILHLDPSGIATLKNDVVPGDTNAELRLVFPSAWLTNLEPGTNISHNNQTKLTPILKQESVWHDTRQAQVNKLLLPLFIIPICIILLLITLIQLVKYKKKFKEQAVSNTKVQDLNPCLIVRLKNWNHEHTYDIVASILHLNELKKLTIKKLHSGDFQISLKNPNFAKNPYRARSIDSLDKSTISFLFGTCATGHFQLTLDDLLNFAKVRCHDFMVGYLAWHSNLSDQVNELTNFKSNYDKIRRTLFGCSIALSLITVVLGIIFSDWITPLCGVATAIIIALIANTLRNKVYFMDSKNHVIHAVDVPIGLAEYNETIDEFKEKMARTLAQAVLTAQDKLC